MKHFNSITFIVCSFLIFIGACKKSDKKDNTNNKPNVVFILADDLGYGDLQVLNKNSKIPTPHMNALGKAGMVFQDAHTNSAVCTPTRYGVLTGRYAWRSRLKRGVLNGYSQHLIDPERTTVADIFKQAGYTTACIGKWHLGMDMPMKPNANKSKFRIDVKQPIKNGPNVNGFDYFYGISASLDFPPYIFMENDGFVGKPSDSLPKGNFPAYARAGEIEPSFKLEDALDVITQKAVGFIEDNSDKPFFLYFPLTAPHKPVLPHQRFRGNTKFGDYGDFLTQVDWTIGQVVATLEKQGLTENTLVILTSDNGSFMRRVGEDAGFPEGSEDHTTNVGLQVFDPKNHTANYVFRGTKADVYEGGHRVPFIAKWPAQIKAGSKNKNTICVTDFFATAAAITNTGYDTAIAGEDSFDLTPLFQQQDWKRAPVIHHSHMGMFAIRKGDWKLILGNGSGGRLAPKGNRFEGDYQLYNMATDIGEKQDLAKKHPEVVQELLSDFDEIHQRTETAVIHPE